MKVTFADGVQLMKIASGDPKVQHRSSMSLALRLGVTDVNNFSLMSAGFA